MAFGRLLIVLTAFGLLINFMMASLSLVQYSLAALAVFNHCTKYFHYLLMFPISWIIDIDSANVSNTHTQHS